MALDYTAPWVLNYGISKIATGIMISRLMKSPSNRKFIWVIYAVMAITMAFAIANTILTIARCTPVAALWDFSMMATASCIDPNAYLSFVYAACGKYHKP